MRIIEVEKEISFAYENGYIICNFASLDCVNNNTLSYKLKKEFRKWKVEYWCRKYVARKNDGALGTALKHHTRPEFFHMYSLFIKRKHYDVYNNTHLNHALHDLKVQMVCNHEENLAMLKSSCAKGKNSENLLEIKKLLENIFADTQINIWLYI